MKDNTHPKYQESVVTCACGNSWTTRSTRAQLRTDLCSACHPFYTGEQRIVDTAGQVDRFMRRMSRQNERAQQVAQASAAAKQPAAQQPAERSNARRAAAPASTLESLIDSVPAETTDTQA